MTAKQRNKLISIIRRTGLWDEAIGFCFLGVSAFFAVSFASASGTSAGKFFSIGLIAGFTTLFITLYAVVGIAFILAGYYLHQVRGKYTKGVLGVSIVLSILAIINILPIVPATLSLYALIRLRKFKLPAQSIKKKPASFDVGNYPALSAMFLLALATTVATVVGLSYPQKTPKTTSLTNSETSEKATCKQSAQQSKGCLVSEPEDDFSAIFPGAPHIIHSSSKRTTGSSYDQDTLLKFHDYIYYVNEGVRSDHPVYEVVMVDYDKTLASMGADQPLHQQGRLNNGTEPVEHFCSEPKGKQVSDFSSFITYKDLPARQIAMKGGTTFGEKSCGFESMTILKGSKIYSISYTSIPSSQDSSTFTNFLQSFSFN